MRKRPAQATAARSGTRPSGEKRVLLNSGEFGAVLGAALAWVGYNSGAVVLNGFAPTVFVERGLSIQTAGALASLIGWGSVPLMLLGGPLAERTGRPLVAAAICLAATSGAVLALAAEIGPPAVALLAAGLLWSLSATTLMMLPARALAPETRAFGMGVYWTVYYGGMGALPPLAGWVADASGGGAVVALGIAVALIVAAIAAIGVTAMLLGRRVSNTRAVK
jgi:MFS family permease